MMRPNKYFAIRHSKQVQQLQSIFFPSNDNLQKHYQLIVSLLYQNNKKDADMILSTDVFNLLLTWKQIPRAIIQRQLLSAKANPLQWKRIF